MCAVYFTAELRKVLDEYNALFGIDYPIAVRNKGKPEKNIAAIRWCIDNKIPAPPITAAERMHAY